jgi:hypothetical protein
MRAGTYYTIAAALVLASLPMYRYIFAHAHDADRPVYVVQPDSSSAPSSQRLPLMPGERCIGGVVVLVNGTSYTQADGPDGHPVRCAEGYAYR